jgi:hypothetical protein
MKQLYYLDTEFNDDGKTIDLISIGLVRGDGEKFYACNAEARLDRVNDWVRANVLPQLPPFDAPEWRTRAQIRDCLELFIINDPEIWGYYADYDWVAFCQLFGAMVDLPRHFPKFCMDLKQLAVTLGNPKIPQQTSGEHHALQDARWNMESHVFLMRLKHSLFPYNIIRNPAVEALF